MRVEDRPLDAERVVWESYDRVPAGSRREVLRALTLALLADVPDETARSALARWIAADPADVEARVALSRRVAAQPRAGDPDRRARLAELEVLLAEHPEQLGARDALVSALADAGEVDRGRALLDAWPGPESGRDARYWRLRGRWELEYDGHPDRAEAALHRALEAEPHDWRTWYRLARALRQLGRDAEARRAAEAVGRIREALEPAALGPRLDDDLREFDLRLMPELNDVSGLPSQGRDLLVVAAVDRVLHFRIFDDDGKMVVDTDEKRLTGRAGPIEDLRNQLSTLWPPHELTGSEKGRVLTAVTPIVGHTHLRHLDDPRAPRDLAALAAQARFTRLADAWRAEADAPAPAAPNDPMSRSPQGR
jgi:tetratricopeptide (TPR) repeat protein